MDERAYRPDIIYVSPEVEEILKRNGFEYRIDKGFFHLKDAKGVRHEYPLDAYSYFAIEKRGAGLSIVYENNHGSPGVIPLKIKEI